MVEKLSKGIGIVLLVLTLIVPLACKAPAEFELISLDIEPPEVVVGERVTITAQVRNIGGSEGTYTAMLTVDGVDGVDIEIRDITLAPEARGTVPFSLMKDTLGTYSVRVDGLSGTFRVLKPAEFTIGNLIITPPIAEVGQPVTVTADITNTGEVGGSHPIALMINGSQLETKELTVAPGATETVSFTFTQDATGSYSIEVGELSGLLLVTVLGSPLAQLDAAYPELYQELLQLPDLKETDDKDNEAIEDIAYLALLSANPEVKEAFELMVKGGTPDQKDFKYKVPDWNTELQVLYWLAEQNEFRPNDTLALAIAMANGLWVTMGNDEVREAVYGDANDLLNFFRETDELQKARGFHCLEDYPLEAKVCLVWMGDQSSIRSYHDPRDYLGKRMDKKAYRWATIDVSTLYSMQSEMEKKGWMQRDIKNAVETLEIYFFFPKGPHWIYPESEYPITVDNQTFICRNFNSADLEFKYYLQNDKGIGRCSDEMGFLNAFLKSRGISTTALWGDLMKDGEKIIGHTHVIYLNPETLRWHAYKGQLEINVNMKFNSFFMTVPKITLRGLKSSNEGEARRFVFSKYILPYINPANIKSMFLSGVPTSTMKQWLLYTNHD